MSPSAVAEPDPIGARVIAYGPMSTPARPWLLLLPWMLLGAPAGAASPADSKIAILPLEVKGALNGDARDALTANLRSGLERGNFTVLPQGDVEARADTPCDRQICYDKLRTTLGADYLIRAKLTVKNRDYEVALELIDTQSGQVVASSSERCDICGLDEVGNQVASQGALMRAKLDAMGIGPAVLVIDSAPSGAAVIIDGEAVGTTPLEHPLIAGVHRVRITKVGYVSDEREITFVSGVTEKLTLDLKRGATSSKMRAIGAGALGGGVAALGAGIALLYFDDNNQIEPKGYCDVPGRRDANNNCEKVLNTSWGGAALAAGGAALITAGVMLLIRHRKPKPENISAAIAPNGVFLQGRF